MKYLPRHQGHQWQRASAATIATLSALLLHIPFLHSSVASNTGNILQVGESAVARSSGGRAGGGSFRRSEPSSRTITPSSPSDTGRSRSFGNPQPQYPPRSNYGRGPVFVPFPYSNYNQPYSSGTQREYQGGGSLDNRQGGANNAWLGLVVVLLLGGVTLATIVWLLPKLTRRAAASPEQEIANNIFTVTKLQVALYASARELQSQLSELGLAVNTDETEGLVRLLQESALGLLRHPEYWTHVEASSRTAPNALEAERLLNELSVETRSKLSVESLVNVGGRSRRSALKPADAAEDPAAYIVVTLLVGTAHDQPLFDQIQTSTELQEALEKMAALPPAYLMTVEVVWSPQDASDSLTEEELLTEYSDLRSI
jgi:uncharacterized membrane protein